MKRFMEEKKNMLKKCEHCKKKPIFSEVRKDGRRVTWKVFCDCKAVRGDYRDTLRVVINKWEESLYGD